MLKNFFSIVFLSLLASLFAGVSTDWNFGRAPAREAKAGLCEHGKLPTECEECNPKLARGGTYIVQEREAQPGECPNVLKRVVLASGVAEAMSFRFQKVRKLKIAEKVHAVGETMYLPSLHAKVAPKISGFLREIRVTMGQEVSSGTPLALLDSVEISRAKADYLQTRAALQLKEYTEAQEKMLVEKKVSAAREGREAKTGRMEAEIAMKAAAHRLQSLGFDPGRVSENDLSGRFSVISPIGGRVAEVSGVVGELSMPDRPLFTIAETSPIWLRIDVFEKDLLKLKPDQKVVFTVTDLPHKRFPGKIVNIGTEMDETSRTGKAYAEIKNSDRLLKAKMFGSVAISLDDSEPRLLIPREALHHDDDCEFVFAMTSKNNFKARRVEVGLILDNAVEIVGGLSEDETVVVEGSFLLKTEVLRSQIGAGCCPDD